MEENNLNQHPDHKTDSSEEPVQEGIQDNPSREEPSAPDTFFHNVYSVHHEPQNLPYPLTVHPVLKPKDASCVSALIMDCSGP